MHFCIWNGAKFFSKSREILSFYVQDYSAGSICCSLTEANGHQEDVTFLVSFYILQEANWMAEINPAVSQYSCSTHCWAEPDSFEKDHRLICLIYVCCVSNLGTTFQGKLAGASTRAPSFPICYKIFNIPVLFPSKKSLENLFESGKYFFC